MKLLKSDGDQLVLQFGRKEKDIFCDLLRHYPAIPPTHHKIGDAGSQSSAAQKLLDEALAEQRRENKERLQALLHSPERFQENELGYRLTLTTAQLEWVLQVLNDIRVGKWIALGSPDPTNEVRVPLNEKNAREAWALELCGHFQSSFLEAIDPSR